MTKVAINGFGRIGRAVLRSLLSSHPKIKVVAINDLADGKTMAHLFHFDTVFGTYKDRVEFKDGKLLINGSKEKEIKVLTEKDPEKLPWDELDVDVVLECTGIFRHLKDAKKHLKAGAKKIIISAPAKSKDIPTYLLGVNAGNYDKEETDVISMGSCTTNCLAPVAKVLDEKIGIEKGFMTTVHSYTTSQNVLDAPNRKDLRRARAAAENIIPTTTGAAQTVEKCLPKLEGKLDGMALRVPTPCVSIVDFTANVKKETTAEEVNYMLRQASKKEDMKGILGVEDAPLVSSDYVGHSYSSVVDAPSTKVKGNLVKLLSWYDNEYGYASRMADFAEKML